LSLSWSVMVVAAVHPAGDRHRRARALRRPAPIGRQQPHAAHALDRDQRSPRVSNQRQRSSQASLRTAGR
jgi:hypothetical protein